MKKSKSNSKPAVSLDPDEIINLSQLKLMMQYDKALSRIKRRTIPVSFETPDPKIVVEPGQSQSVEKLFKDYVLGKLDPRDIGGGAYDSEEGKITEDVDPFNSFGMTLEQADSLRQDSAAIVRNAKQEAAKKTVANAKTDAMQPEKPGKSENANPTNE